MCKILRGVWEILRQPFVSAERTRRCQARKCWHLSLDEELCHCGFRKSLKDWMLREMPSASKRLQMVIDAVSLLTECLQEDLCSSLEDCWTDLEQLSRSDEDDFTWEGLGPIYTRRPLAFQARGFASEQEGWEFSFAFANHVKE
eukprot:1672303-Amphidinium_carterae.1